MTLTELSKKHSEAKNFNGKIYGGKKGMYIFLDNKKVNIGNCDDKVEAEIILDEVFRMNCEVEIFHEEESERTFIFGNGKCKVIFRAATMNIQKNKVDEAKKLCQKMATKINYINEIA